MNSDHLNVEERFLKELSKQMSKENEMTLKAIYSLFPEMNKKTISWRLHALVQQNKLFKTGHGIYSIKRNNVNNSAAGYDYLQKKSKKIYDILVEYGYDFYITGMDALVGEILHVPENYPVLITVEASGMKEVQDVLNEREMIVLTEKDHDFLGTTILNNKVDAIILRGKDFSMATDNIAQKEKGFIDLYYAVTRMEYSISIQELSRIYQSMQRNNSFTMAKMKKAGKDRGIDVEVNWLIEQSKIPEKALAFMNDQIEGAK